MDRSMIRYASILIVWIGTTWGCAAVPLCPSADTSPVPTPPAASSKVPTSAALEHKVKAQEQQIAELSMQLRMLKRIDLDVRKER